jgi:hypothetical protein
MLNGNRSSKNMKLVLDNICISCEAITNSVFSCGLMKIIVEPLDLGKLNFVWTFKNYKHVTGQNFEVISDKFNITRIYCSGNYVYKQIINYIIINLYFLAL